MGTVKLGAQWDAPDSILDPLNFKSLAVIMKETTAECHPRVHSAWDHIIAALLRPSDGGAVSTVVAFWKIVVDDCLFASLSHERKYLGLRLLATYLGRMVDRGVAVASLLTPQLLRCLLNNLGNPTTNLHKCANQTVW